MSPQKKPKQTDVKGPDSLLLDYIRHKNRPLARAILGQERSASQERLLGCVLGLAVGDILGCPVEGMRFSDIQARYGRVDRLLTPPYWRHWRLPGLHSDDTQQALAVLEAIRRLRRLSGEIPPTEHDIAAELASIYVDGMQAHPGASFGCWRGTGHNFRQVVERLSRNRPAPRWPFGYGAPSAGLGAVMRIPPAGLLPEDFPGVARLVAHITCVSHTDPLATVSACAIALACHMLRQEAAGTFEPDLFLSRLHQKVHQVEQALPAVPHVDLGRQVEPLVSGLISLAGQLIEVTADVAMRRLAQHTQDVTGQQLHPTGGFAPAGVAACLYFFLHDAQDPHKALLTSINAGGDTDTIGAIVGALCGTLHGVLAYRAFLPDIVALDLIVAKALAATDPHEGDDDDLIEEETFLTETEQALRALLGKYQTRRR